MAAFLGILATSVAGCTRPTIAGCSPGFGHAMLVFDLFLGQSIPGRNDLTEPEWQAFLDDTVTVNLPNGYTVLDAAGAWMNPITHKTITDASRVIMVALPDVPDSLASVNRVRTEYQIRFHQEMVGLTVTPACGSF
jgi:hypothetical protein